MTINAAILDGEGIVTNIIVLNDLSEHPGAIDAAGGGIGWLWDGQQLTPPAPPVSELSQFDRDQARYIKRAAVKDQLIAYMAADNMGRVRAGTWTVQDLTALLDDPAVVAANTLIGTLSFELAAQAIAAASTPLLTPAIKADWVGRLHAHFYLEG